ncbi:HPr family phosphocarrier protein [Niallia circulans]|uniref:Phosphocarrier protein HPr n=1 Tax=Niallia circulans TaxID=1397 RepID=A0A553SRH5_NIACI|nr:HPr family phosphocarrier protein [Niallia circulans]TRZ39571.1 HPr family phosphocarrier protein [Niallia circulans]
MFLKDLTVCLQFGFSAINTTRFVHKACSYNSEIFLIKNGRSSCGKEIMKLMELGIKDGDNITLLVHGDDECKAVNVLKNFLISK